MNDTVVVFDRFRENLRKYKRMPLARGDRHVDQRDADADHHHQHDRACWRWSALAVFGGPSLYGLSVIMLFGIVIGTYSSIYIAAPVILLWGVKRGGEDESAEPLKPAERPLGRRRRVARDAPSIDAYGDGGFRLSGEWHEGSLLIVADEAQRLAGRRAAPSSRRTACAGARRRAAPRSSSCCWASAPRNALPPRDVREALLAAGMGLEFMDTPGGGQALQRADLGGPPAGRRADRGLKRRRFPPASKRPIPEPPG